MHPLFDWRRQARTGGPTRKALRTADAGLSVRNQRRSVIHGRASERLLMAARGCVVADRTDAGWMGEERVLRAVGSADIVRTTGLPIDQLIDITACAAPLLDHDEVAAWTSSDLLESVVVREPMARQTSSTFASVSASFPVSAYAWMPGSIRTTVDRCTRSALNTRSVATSTTNTRRERCVPKSANHRPV